MAQGGDKTAQQIVHAAMRYLGMAIADVQKLLDPEVFVIGGGVASVGEYFYTHVQNYAREFAKGFSDVTILPAHFWRRCRSDWGCHCSPADDHAATH